MVRPSTKGEKSAEVGAGTSGDDDVRALLGFSGTLRIDVGSTLAEGGISDAETADTLNDLDLVTPELAPKTAGWKQREMDREEEEEEAAGDVPAKERACGKKQAWTPEEDEKLQALVEEHGASNWSNIAAHLPGRIGKQCRERWHNHLSPEVKKCGFSAEEDKLIMEAVAEHGTKWAFIVKLVPGRTDNAIKNRWNSQTRRLLRVQRRGGQPVEGVDEHIDIEGMSASDLAKYLLAHNVDTIHAAPPANPSAKPSAKRKLAMQGDSAAVDAPPRKAAKPLEGLHLLSRAAIKSPARFADAGCASPRAREAALSLCSSPRSLGRSVGPRHVAALLLDAVGR